MPSVQCSYWDDLIVSCCSLQLVAIVVAHRVLSAIFGIHETSVARLPFVANCDNNSKWERFPLYVATSAPTHAKGRLNGSVLPKLRYH